MTDEEKAKREAEAAEKLAVEAKEKAEADTLALAEANKPKTVEELMAENKKIAKALKDANFEAANRRKKLEAFEKAEEERKLAELSETERLKAELGKRDSELQELTTKQQQREAADKVGLPPIFADRIKGKTPEEMEADAQTLLEAMPKGKAAPNAGATSPGDQAITGETEAEKRKRLFG